MTVEKTEYHANGRNELVKTNATGPVRLWKRIRVNEWTFILSIFIISLSIIIRKLCINYGYILQEQGDGQYNLPSTSVFSHVYDTLGVSSISELHDFNTKRLTIASGKFVDVSSEYEEVVTNVLVSFSKKYGWLIRATISGMITMSFTWFIIYKDSSIPGINPPSPFSATTKRTPESLGIQMQYLTGVLNGILIFIYMCL